MRFQYFDRLEKKWKPYLDTPTVIDNAELPEKIRDIVGDEVLIAHLDINVPKSNWITVSHARTGTIVGCNPDERGAIDYACHNIFNLAKTREGLLKAIGETTELLRREFDTEPMGIVE